MVNNSHYRWFTSQMMMVSFKLYLNDDDGRLNSNYDEVNNDNCHLINCMCWYQGHLYKMKVRLF